MVDELHGYAGNLFLRMAEDGRLKLDPVLADRVIADLEKTLFIIETRLKLIRAWRSSDADVELAGDTVDAVFQEQMCPGQMERAIVELPKYLEALRRARRIHR